MHRYEQIAADLRNAIARGDYPEGATLPSENDIIRGYRVARNTAREALKLICREGLAVAVKGRGTIVTRAEASPGREQIEASLLARHPWLASYEAETDPVRKFLICVTGAAEEYQRGL